MNKFIVVAFIALSTSNVLAQEETKIRTSGISASLQNNAFGINIPIWLSQKFILAPSLGINYAGNVGTDYTIGVMPKFYLKEVKKLVPFIDFRLAGIFNSPQSSVDKTSKTDWLLGIGYGGEYFFNDNFSVAAEFQGNATISDKNSSRFGNPGNMNFNLSTAITVNIYFTK